MLARAALDCFNFTLAFAELNAKSATLALSFWNLAKKEGTPYQKNSLQFLRSVDGNIAAQLYKKISESQS
jgi:hypothetical protein